MSDAADDLASSSVFLSSPAPMANEDETQEEPPSENSTATRNPAEGGSSGASRDGAEAPSAWREQLSERLTQYRSRHKVRPPRYPSLRLPFEDPLHSAGSNDALLSSTPSFNSVSNQALAQGWAEPASPPSAAEASPSSGPAMSAAAPSRAPSPTPEHTGAKIIEFPRSAEVAPTPPSDELAEPVIDRPRILDVPEVAAPPPALGGITMEAPQRDEVEKRPGIDIPLQSAPTARRLLATVIDGLIIGAASALFGLIFWKITAIRPPRLQIFGLAAGITSLFWAAYQYLLIVYSGSTPGMRLAGLEINRFNGTLANRRLRRWRVLASYLSAASLGMGYAWVFLDEDSLCWHDRITHTYLAPIRRDSH
jgi:uncharacterized RDD family membrane protein YckC